MSALEGKTSGISDFVSTRHGENVTFGPSQHKAEALAVFLLQEHRLLLDYIVTGREETQADKSDVSFL